LWLPMRFGMPSPRVSRLRLSRVDFSLEDGLPSGYTAQRHRKNVRNRGPASNIRQEGASAAPAAKLARYDQEIE